MISDFGPDLPVKVCSHTMISINNEVSMLIGGDVEDSMGSQHVSYKTWFYNHTNDEWTLGPELIIGRCDHTAGIITDKISHEEYVVIVGGGDSFGEVINSVELLKLNAGELNWKHGKIQRVESCKNKHLS